MRRLLIALAALASLSSALAQNGVPGTCGPGMPCPTISLPAVPNFSPNNGLPKWRIARNKVTAGAANATVLAIGESTPRGWGAMFNLATNDAASGAWPVQVAVQLRQIWGINGQANSFAGSGNTGAIAAFTAYDTRISAAGSWTVNNSANCYSPTTNTWPGGCSFTAANTTPLQFNPKNTTTYPSAPTVPTDTIDIYTFNVNGSSGGGNVTVNVNGGATLCTITQGGAGATTETKTTCSTGSAAADNTWNIACTTLTFCFFDAVVVRNSAVSEASFINMGMGAALVGNWNLTAAGTGEPNAPLSMIQNLYVPDLCMIQDQGNDQDAGTTIANYKSGLTAIVQACQASGDVLIVTSQQGQPLAQLTSPVANTSLSCASGTVTVTTSAAHNLTVGNTPWVTIAGVTPSGYNGSFQASVTGASTFTYALACPGAETVPGTWKLVVPPYDVQATYAAAAVQVGGATSVPVLDWFTTMCGTISGSGASSTCSKGGWTAGIANGWNGSFNGGAQDIVHQGPYAYAILASQIAAILAN